MKVNEVTSPAPSNADIIPLAQSDHQPILAALSFALVMPLEGGQAFDIERLKKAAADLLVIYPALASRQAPGTSLDVESKLYTPGSHGQCLKKLQAAGNPQLLLQLSQTAGL